MRNKRGHGKKRRVIKSLFMLILLAAIGAVGWNYVKPLMMEQKITRYASYTVEKGDIAAEKSFSAAISVLNSETHANTTGATSIKEMYVSAGQTVKKGDKLMLLDDGTLLEAGLDGVVNEMRFGMGDWLWQNIQLIQVCDLENLKVTLSVDEYDVEKVEPGQKCTVTIIPLGIDFETEIKHVNRVSASSGQVAYYTATAELAVPENVLPGMSASVTIPGSQAQDVLLLDVAALAFDENENPYVLRKEGEEYTRVPVETGLSDGMKIQIVSGLEEGETVWAEDGAQTVTASFSLVDLYKRIAGETVIINDMSESGRGGRGGSFTLPEGMQMPEGMESGMFQRADRQTATDTDLPEGGGQRQRPSDEGEGERNTTNRPEGQVE